MTLVCTLAWGDVARGSSRHGLGTARWSPAVVVGTLLVGPPFWGRVWTRRTHEGGFPSQCGAWSFASHPTVLAGCRSVNSQAPGTPVLIDGWQSHPALVCRLHFSLPFVSLGFCQTLSLICAKRTSRPNAVSGSHLQLTASKLKSCSWELFK